MPSYVIALGEAQAAAGQRAAAAQSFALVRVETMLQQRAGVNADVELALFEADHGSPRRAVALGRRAWAAAPSVRSADALGWALHRAGHGLRSGRVDRGALEASLARVLALRAALP